MFSPSELERYSRQLGVEGWDQEKLRRAKILVVGAGGLGGVAATFLAAAGIGEIRLCDFDSIELSNLNRQILYSTSQIGRVKVEQARKRLFEFNPEIKIIAIERRLDEHNFAELASGCDLLIDGLDNHVTRLMLNKAAFKAGIPYIYGAVYGWQGLISFFRPPETPCLACIMPETITTDSSTPVFGAVPGVIGSLEAIEAIKYLTGAGKLLLGQILIYHGDKQELEILTADKNPQCPVCSK
jgi:adenylyltransferase/sulfurtransferase